MFQTMLELDDMPEEVLIYAFSFLNLYDRKNVRLVSKRWLQLCSDISLIKRDVTVVDYHKMDDYVSPNIDHVINLRIYALGCEPQTSDQQQEFLAKYGENVTKVHLIFNCLKQLTVLPHIIKGFPNIQHLKIGESECQMDRCECYFDDFVACNPCRKSLNLVSFQLFPVKCPLMRSIFESITNGAVMLRALHIDAEPFEDYIINLDFVVDFLETQATSQLTELVIKTTHHGNHLIRPIIRALHPLITKLALYYVDYSAEDIDYISQKFLHLRKIQLSINPECPENDIISFFYRLPTLTHVFLDSFTFTENTAHALGSLPNLACLELRFCDNLTDRVVKRLIGEKQRPKIKFLRINRLEITDDCMEVITLNLPNLRVLYIDGCNNALTNVALEAICRNNQRLQSMFIQGTFQIANLRTSTLVGCLKELMHLDITRWHMEEGVETLDFISSVLDVLKCTKLKTILVEDRDLDLKDPAAFASIFSAQPTLQYIAHNYTFSGFTGFGNSSKIIYTLSRELKFDEVVSCDEWWEVPSFMKR